MRKVKRVFGVGVNDAEYVVEHKKHLGYFNGKQKQVTLSVCPYYSAWRSMLMRCYSDKYHKQRPTYKGCSVCDNWKSFSNFKAWMETQDWQGKQLDKDLLVPGNKIYSPETCVFLSTRLNSFTLECTKSRGDYPIGVCYMKRAATSGEESSKPYVARCRDIFGKKKHLGTFETPEEAHQAWLEAKLNIARELAADILSDGGDPRIADALVKRYENYNVREVDK